MKKITLLFTILLLFACTDKTISEKQGGVVRMCLDNEPGTYLSYEISDYYSATVFRQVMEGLVSFNPQTLETQAQLAKSWSVSDDGLIYTFELRNNVYFHPNDAFKNDEERLFVIEDVIKTFELICSPNDKNNSTFAYSYFLKENLKGATDYYNGKTKSISGVVNNNGKLELHLTKKDNSFLYKLAQIYLAIQAKEIIKANAVSDVVGTGPFKYITYKSNDLPSIHLARNEAYYELDEEDKKLPYLDSLTFIFQHRKLEQLDLFENKKVDMILSLPTSKITEMVQGRLSDFNSVPPKLILYRNALLNTNYYNFNMDDPRFKDVRVRKAFNYAINKQRLGREILKNQYNELGFYGIVPPIPSSFRAYDFDKVKEHGYSFNPEKARKLLAQAGYPEGKDFGSVHLRYSIGDVNAAVADEFSQQIYQVLGITVNIDGTSFEQLIDDARKGKGDIFKMAWIADYPSPENFLINFKGTNIPNDSINKSGFNYAKYNNPKYDLLLDQASAMDDIAKKMKTYSKAEMLLLDDAPLIPLWYNGDLQLIYSDVRNIHFNALRMFNFKKVYLKPWTAEEFQNKVSTKK